MKLLSIAIPCYNSAEYMSHAIESLLPGGDEVEILVVNDGSQKDNTLAIAQDYERRYPGIVKAIDKENGGHGDAVMAGLRNATGMYFKVVDSDDWVDEEAYPKVLETLRGFVREPIDMLISNYVYDKVGVEHKHVVSYHGALKAGKVLGWDDVGHFRKGQYMLMHSVIYRTQMLHDCGLTLPKHTFYVDSIYVYVPMTHVQKLYYLDVNFYHYYIGRDDQSVQEQVMIRRYDQQLTVNRLMITGVDLFADPNKTRRNYMMNYLEIITTVSSILAIRSGSEELIQKRDELWAFMKEKAPQTYNVLRRRLLGRITNMKSKFGRSVAVMGYRIAQKIFGFN